MKYTIGDEVDYKGDKSKVVAYFTNGEGDWFLDLKGSSGKSYKDIPIDGVNV